MCFVAKRNLECMFRIFYIIFSIFYFFLNMSEPSFTDFLENSLVTPNLPDFMRFDTFIPVQVTGMKVSHHMKSGLGYLLVSSLCKKKYGVKKQ